MSSILFFFQGARRRVILSERAERARAKDLLEERAVAELGSAKSRSFAPAVLRRSFAPAALRMTTLGRFAKWRSRNLPFLPETRGAVILSERAERARAKDLLFPHVVPEGRAFAPGGKQVLRACGAQDDSARSLRKGRGRNLPFLPETRGACHPERARGTRASEGPA